jgi:hypothetical protein
MQLQPSRRLIRMVLTYPETLDIGGLNLTPAKTGLLLAVKHKSELLHFGYVTQ